VSDTHVRPVETDAIEMPEVRILPLLAAIRAIPDGAALLVDPLDLDQSG
jgi:hypothetical protein